MDGIAVGTFALLVMDSVAHGIPSAILEDMVVDRDWRGRGIGKGMMAFAVKICRDKGCRKLMLSSNLQRHAAHKFYESLGLRKHGYSFYADLDEVG